MGKKLSSSIGSKDGLTSDHGRFSSEMKNSRWGRNALNACGGARLVLPGDFSGRLGRCGGY